VYAGAVKLPEMRRIGVFVQVLINDIAQLLPEGENWHMPSASH
jgi:hypothetical protein